MFNTRGSTQAQRLVLFMKMLDDKALWSAGICALTVADLKSLRRATQPYLRRLLRGPKTHGEDAGNYVHRCNSKIKQILK